MEQQVIDNLNRIRPECPKFFEKLKDPVLCEAFCLYNERIADISIEVSVKSGDTQAIALAKQLEELRKDHLRQIQNVSDEKEALAKARYKNEIERLQQQLGDYKAQIYQVELNAGNAHERGVTAGKKTMESVLEQARAEIQYLKQVQEATHETLGNKLIDQLNDITMRLSTNKTKGELGEMFVIETLAKSIPREMDVHYVGKDASTQGDFRLSSDDPWIHCFGEVKFQEESSFLKSRKEQLARFEQGVGDAFHKERINVALFVSLNTSRILSNKPIDQQTILMSDGTTIPVFYVSCNGMENWPLLANVVIDQIGNAFACDTHTSESDVQRKLSILKEQQHKLIHDRIRAIRAEISTSKGRQKTLEAELADLAAVLQKLENLSDYEESDNDTTEERIIGDAAIAVFEWMLKHPKESGVTQKDIQYAISNKAIKTTTHQLFKIEKWTMGELRQAFQTWKLANTLIN